MRLLVLYCSGVHARTPLYTTEHVYTTAYTLNKLEYSSILHNDSIRYYWHDY
jgi:hypothetical protein